MQAWAEVALAQLVVHDVSMSISYGVSDAAVQLVPDESGSRWPYLSFSCFGGGEMALRYRVTLLARSARGTVSP